MSEITQNIWLGPSDNIDYTKYQAIVSIVPYYQIPKCVEKFKNTGDFLHISILDFDDEFIFPYIDRFIKFMDEKINEGKIIYIHCIKGISRSATFVSLYLMYHQKIYDYQYILDFVKSKRPQINPNRGFIRSLEIIQEWLKTNELCLQKCDLLEFCYTYKPLYSLNLYKLLK